MIDRAMLARVYRTFYRPDRGLHLLIAAVLAGALAVYTGLPGAIRSLTELALAGTGPERLAGPASTLALSYLALAALALAQSALLDYVLVVRVLNRAQPLLLEHTLRSPLDFFEGRSPGDLRSVMVNLVAAAASNTMALVTPLTTAVQALYLLLMMALVSLPLTLISLAVLSGYTLLALRFQRDAAAELERRNGAERAVSAAVDEIYRGFPEIKRSGLEQTVLAHFDRRADGYFTSTRRYFARVIGLSFAGDFVGRLLPAILLIAAAAPALTGAVTPATFVTVYSLSILLSGLVKSLQAFNTAALAGLAGWREALELLDSPPEPQGGRRPADASIAWQAVGKTLRGRPVLDGVSLDIQPGEKLMVAGRSGAGKSTFLKLLPGLLQPDTGAVLVGGLAAAEADPALLRARVAFVTQSPYLFETSLRDNLTYGRAADEAELLDTLRLVQLDGLLARLPDGLDALLGPNGHTLSGGERARVALARALLRRPDILILDEATAGLDSETEERIYARLLRLPCTVIGVTHRLATLRLFPRVIALADGRIALDGPTAQVVAAPLFQELFALQLEAAGQTTRSEYAANGAHHVS